MVKLFRNINQSLGLKVILTFLSTVTLSIGLISGIAYTQSYQVLVANLGQRSVKIAEVASKRIDIEAFRELKTIEDEETKAYKEMRGSLSELRELTGTKYLYTMRKDDKGQFIYVVDGSEIEEISHIGDIEESNVVFETVWEGNKYISNTIDVGPWGILVSSYFPLIDEKGEVVGFVGADYDVEVEYKSFQRFKVVLLSVTLGLLIFAVFLGVLLSSKILSPIKILMKLMQKAEKGDLTVRVQVTSKDEIGKLSASFNRMAEYITRLIKRVHDNSVSMSESSQKLKRTVEAISAETNTVNISVNEITIGMEQTSAAVEEITAASNEIIIDVKALLDKANNSSETVKEIKKRANQMKNNMQKSNDVTQEIYKERQYEMMEAIEKGRVVAEIKTMADIISRISERINLIAVNAAIEAARAGECGRGFAVVAEEVRTLAKQSSQTVKGIDEIVKQVQQAFGNLSDTSQGMLDFIDNKVISDYKILMDTGAQYLKDAECMEGLINNFVSHSKGVAVTVNEVNYAIESVATTVEQTTLSLQEISKSTSQTVVSVQEVGEISKRQAHEAEHLSSMIKTLFETN
ncbi:MAG: hypothetical protein K0S71_1103 [Clostridia bacterium]|jgi:methyl-accepting chemotaxis protein|nr:hypothetical protein [Clostridia bacterium]